jgi:peptide/nickel transport system substrate-binding protein
MQKVQSDLKEVGISVTLTPVDFTVWGDKIGTDGIPLTAIYFAPDHTDSSQYVQYFGLIPDSSWSKYAGAVKGPMINQTEVDLFKTALATADPAKRAGIYKQEGQAMIDDTFVLPMVSPELFLAYRSNITNMHYSACCNLELGALGLKG